MNVACQQGKVEQVYIKGILKLVLTHIFTTHDEGCFFSI